jgi:hypothetical protein
MKNQISLRGSKVFSEARNHNRYEGHAALLRAFFNTGSVLSTPLQGSQQKSSAGLTHL